MCTTACIQSLRIQPPVLQDVALEQLFIDTFNPLTFGFNDGILLPTVLDPGLLPDKNVNFYLFTRTNPLDGYLLKVNDTKNLRQSPFNSYVITKIIIHGWTDSSKSSWLTDFKHNYLANSDYNIIFVDWFPISAIEYGIAAKLTRQVS